MKRKIAVIGSGFFGVSCSLILSRKYDVDLYEKEKTILCGASRANQMRFHLGYHYPRSLKTLKEVNELKDEFTRFYGLDIFGKTKNLYGVSAVDTKTSFNKYLNFLKKNNLKYKQIVSEDFSNIIEGVILCSEKNLNYFRIKRKILNKLKKSKVNLYLNTTFKKQFIKNYEKIIVSVYDQNNIVLRNLGVKPTKKFKYELVEKIVIKLPAYYKNKSYMIIDGNFVCLDPYLGTKYHLISDVKYSKIEKNIGLYPNFYDKRKKFLNTGIIKNKKISEFDNFITHGSKFLPFLKKAKYIGSFFVTRAIESDKEKTDERLNLIKKINSKFITIFSGKWNTCVSVAKHVDRLIAND